MTLYDRLLSQTPTPIVALNRAIAVAELHGPAAALSLVDGLDLDAYHLYHATRGDLLERLHRTDEAAAAFAQAVALVTNSTERDHLERRRQAVTKRGSPSIPTL